MVTWTSQLAGLHHESRHIVSIRHWAQCLGSLSSCHCCPMRELLWCKMLTAPEETCKRTHHRCQYCSDAQISHFTHPGWLQICFSGMKRFVWKHESALLSRLQTLNHMNLTSLLCMILSHTLTLFLHPSISINPSYWLGNEDALTSVYTCWEKCPSSLDTLSSRVHYLWEQTLWNTVVQMQIPRTVSDENHQSECR